MIVAGMTIGLLSSTGFGQTLKGMEIVGKYIKPQTQSAASGVWGWTGSDGKEYALLTSRTPGGISFVDISTPATPKEIGFIAAGHNSVWHEVTSYKNYCYKVSQQGTHGLQIIDMAPMNQGQAPKLISNFTKYFTFAHTVYADSTTTPARLYVTYMSTAGVLIMSLADPTNPVEIGKLPGESHDMFARGDKLYISTQRRATLEIWNVANPASPVRLSTTSLAAKSKELGEIPANGSTIAHNAWPSEDNKILYTTEETANTTMKSWNIENPAAPKMLGTYIGVKGVITHNVFIRNNLAYVAHYTAGLRIVDITDPANMKELALHRPSTSNATYGGSWGAYPWYKSGLVIHGDDADGLYIMKPTFSTSVAGAKVQSNFAVTGANHGAINFRLPKTGKYVLSIFTPAGKEVFNYRAMGNLGLQSLALGGGKLANGSYLVNLRQDSQVISAPVALGN
jgi:choice-of-anchor B domain-containing protein